MDYRQTSEQYKITYQQIYSWVKKYQEQGEAGLLDHRGKRRPVSEYSAEEKASAKLRQFKAKLDGIHATQSMSHPGRCINNDSMECFWGVLKSGMYYLQQFHTFEDLEKAIDEYIVFYSTRRLQTKLKGLAPLAFRNQTLAA